MRRGVANDLEHRRGLVLGLTLAEALLLLLFLLLLALGSQVIDLKDEAEKALAERKALEGTIFKTQNIPGAEEKLNAAIAEAAELQKQLTALEAEKNGLASQLREQARRSDRLSGILEKASKIDPNDPPAVLERSLAWIEQNGLQALSPVDPKNALSSQNAESSKDDEKATPGKGKHNWPPIIILSEADKYSFASGSADLSPEFQSALSKTVVERLLQIINEYDVNVVEVVGHTDEQALHPRYSNLDKTLASFVDGSTTEKLIPSDNAGLGFARAVSVVKILAADERLKGLSILPLSGAQMVDIGDKISTTNSHAPAEKRRRIEIRVRRSSAIVEGERPQTWAPITTSALGKANLAGEVSIVDGDTFDLGTIRIRLWGIDAIESEQRCFANGGSWDCGAEATKSLKEHLRGQKVECVVQSKDHFGRTVAKCTANGEDIGGWLVRTGMALDFARYSKGAYAKQEREAHSSGAGIWRGSFEMPWKWRKTHH